MVPERFGVYKNAPTSQGYAGKKPARTFRRVKQGWCGGTGSIVLRTEGNTRLYFECGGKGREVAHAHDRI